MANIRCFLVEKTEKKEPRLCEGETVHDSIWRRTDTGEEMLLHRFPAGAMWFAPWYSDLGSDFNAPDGTSLIVKTPGGDWMVDSRASNCTMKDDKIHKCWVRHGQAPDITVDKNGVTCSAGAGSVIRGNYHGFLRGGFLVDC